MAMASRSPAQIFALVLGVVYLAIGVLGVFVANDFVGGEAEDKLIVFRVNHLHNLIHVALGAIWISASRSFGIAKNVNVFLGATLLLLAFVGFTGIDLVHTLLNITSSTDPDNFLHLVTGGLSVYFGTAGAGAASPQHSAR